MIAAECKAAAAPQIGGVQPQRITSSSCGPVSKSRSTRKERAPQVMPEQR